MGSIVRFPLEQRPFVQAPVHSQGDVDSPTAQIIILPVVRIERMDVTPPHITPNGPKKRRKRA